MSKKSVMGGSHSARIVGTLIIMYGALSFCVSLFAAVAISWPAIIILIFSALAIFVGIGLCNCNYHSWLIAFALNIINLISKTVQLIQAYTTVQSINAPDVAIKLIWPLIIFILLYHARNDCKAQIENNPGDFIWSIKCYSPVLFASALTLATALYIKNSVDGGLAFIVFGFPFLIIQFALLHVGGQSLRKKLGWDSYPKRSFPE